MELRKMWLDLMIVFLGLSLLIIGLYIFVKWKILWRENQMSRSGKQRRLITQGIYSHVRHPHYLSIILLFLACSLIIEFILKLSFPLSVLLFVPSIIMFILFYGAMIQEENTLVNQFGDKYLEYKKRVPRLIPRIVISKPKQDKNEV